MLRSNGGGYVAVGTSLDGQGLSREMKRAILEREDRDRKRRAAMPKRKKPDYMKPGPVTIIQLSR